MTESKGLINPIRHALVICPICDQDEIDYYSLKTKSLASKQNVFSIPIYLETPKYLFIDYNDYSFSVCHNCFFTAVKKEEFIYIDSFSGQKTRSILFPKIISEWKSKKEEIESLLTDNFVDANSYKYPRTSEGVISSIKLAIYRCGLEINLKTPYSYLRRAKYYLKHFYSHRKYYKSDNLDILKLALTDLEMVFTKSDFPDVSFEYEVLYLIIAIYLRLEDEPGAANYMKVMDKTKSEVMQKSKADPRVSTTDILKWLTRAKDLWQEKAEPTVWEVLNPWPKR